MAQLFGFKKYTGTGVGGGSVKELAENYVKRSTNDFGEVNDPQVYRKAMEMLRPYSSDLTVANTMLDYENKARKLEDNLKTVSNDKSTQDYYLNEAKLAIAEKSYAQPKSLVFQLANLYNNALDNYNNVVLPRAMKGLESGQAIPADLAAWGEELKSKAGAYKSLASSYTDPAKSGPDNPDAFGVFIRTNPLNGKIINIDVNTVDSIDGAPKGYLKSDAQYGKIPVYLNSFDQDGKAVGRIGQNKFEISDDGKQLKLDAQARSKFKAIFTSDTFAKIDEDKASLDFKNLADTEFDNFDVPANSIIKDANNNYYYTDPKNQLWQVKDKNTLVNYLNQSGQKKINSDNLDGNAFQVSSDFIASKGLNDPKTNKPRVLDDVVNPSPTVTPTPGPSFTPTPTPSPEVMSGNPRSQIADARQQSTNPPAQKEQSGLSKFLNTAKSIFTGGSSRTA